jgi:hypothetical protein
MRRSNLRHGWPLSSIGQEIASQKALAMTRGFLRLCYTLSTLQSRYADDVTV